MKKIILSALLLGSGAAALAYEVECGGKIACGYPSYDQNANVTILHPGMAFKEASGYPVNPKVGARDFILQGKLKHIDTYLNERSSYKVIGQTLEDDGKWHDEGSRPLSVVISNQGTDATQIVGEYIRDRVLDALTGGNVQLVQGKLDEIAKSMGLSLPSESLQQMASAIDNKGKSESFNYLVNYFMRLKNGANAAGGHMVMANKPLIVTLTTYPAPKTNARAVCSLGSATVTVDKVRATVDNFFKNKGCD
ncbi:hypothetical protein K6W16_20115 [Burkholderia dolosa]|uniref:Lipoprotein n=1 Tax=Burkholderia dolosa TaxID=152500 RepID=A0A892ID56_9BURK|nr:MULTISPECIES: hypothetical protein [Burkholderia]AJY10546.1 hypothetical protein AK34_4700 [Burkholderia dolosa AU0158]MBR8313158.1 hypothetical protein [Burkholderia dolosa]MBR8415757.1 hypothetical protein [Burkholderia dolosa]MBY4659598.1 hypothetical protein [Burkholderia dolosa]MBY4690680.1 hypothetical protein [Burkholderia dolosa]